MSVECLLLLLYATRDLPLPYALSESRFYLMYKIEGCNLGAPNKTELNLMRMEAMWD
jgi:hypothetical protein